MRKHTITNYLLLMLYEFKFNNQHYAMLLIFNYKKVFAFYEFFEYILIKK